MSSMSETGLHFIQLSQERVSCPLIPELLHLGKQVGEKNGVLSVRYGKRLVSTASPQPLNNLNQGMFVEVVDYDPVKNVLVFIGEHPPDDVVAVHWLVLRVREDVNLVVHVYDDERSGGTPLRQAKELLKVLGDGYVFKGKKEVVFLSKGFKDVSRLTEGI